MRVLLDTCVISELQRRNGHPVVRAQVEACRTRDLFLSAITIGDRSSVPVADTETWASTSRSSSGPSTAARIRPWPASATT